MGGGGGGGGREEGGGGRNERDTERREMINGHGPHNGPAAAVAAVRVGLGGGSHVLQQAVMRVTMATGVPPGGTGRRSGRRVRSATSSSTWFRSCDRERRGAGGGGG